MSPVVRKVHNSTIPSLDLQIVEIIRCLNGQGNPGTGVAIPSDHGKQYTLYATLMKDESGSLILDESGHTIPQLVLTEL
jgi:hypothetical protein